ncbi:MAG: DUF4177 domain-containing protein [Clostridiaceae bacterium]|nr:DUF4177 domain-containing protein [Clostridiaceae bacterium]
MQKWEYISVKTEAKGLMGGKFNLEEFDSKLNDLGEKGWELVSSFTTNKGYGETRDIVSILKRKK